MNRIIFAAVLLLPSTAHATSYLYAEVSPTYTSSGQVKSAGGTIVVPQSQSGFAFRSYTVNLFGTAGYIAQAVLADPNADGTWYEYAEVYDAAMQMDWKSDMYRVSPGDVVDMSVIRISDTDTLDMYTWTVRDETTGHFQPFTPDWGMRPMGFGAGARFMLEWSDGGTCSSMNGTGFSNIHMSEVGQYTSPWNWPQGISTLTWSASVAHTNYQDFGDTPRCTFGTFVPTQPPQSFFGILEFTAL